MSSSLDKLKALSSRLDEKIESKNETQSLFDIKETKVITPQDSAVGNTDRGYKEKRHGSTGRRQDDRIRENNIVRVKELFEKLNISDKSPDFDKIFIYKAMNLSGIGLKKEDFGEARAGKYIQVIAITYEPDKNGRKKAKNISLGYFGKAETLEITLKNEIIEFILRWRYEKAFQNLEHYRDLLTRVNSPLSE